MFFEALAILGISRAIENARDRNRISQWKQKEYDQWSYGIGGNCPPPPLSSSWWDNAVRPSKDYHDIMDSTHFMRCKYDYHSAYMAEKRK
jgi:hypothetical protein